MPASSGLSRGPKVKKSPAACWSSPKGRARTPGAHSVAFTLDRYSHTIKRLHDDAAAKIDAIFRAPVAKL
jgi:hypothetical protein